MLSAPVTGSDAAAALERIAAVGDLFGFGSSVYRAQLDFLVPGRVACVWRSNGVWVELWRSDTPSDAPAPTRALSGPSGRLPFTRNRKENTPA
jgi:hypothetical protein